MVARQHKGMPHEISMIGFERHDITEALVKT